MFCAIMILSIKEITDMFRIDETKIVDEYGRERIFRGINLCFKLRTFADIKRLKWMNLIYDLLEQNGVNLVRLGFTWSALEPIENQYDEEAFYYFKEVVKKLQEKNIYILLDCHQDLFFCNKGVGDGAPEWLTKAYKKSKPMVIWAEGYFYMKSVQQAFNDFWDNKNGMQDKFVRLWKKITSEFAEFDNVIAYDYLNEPMIYGSSNKVFCAMINEACKQGLGFDFDANKYYQNGEEKIGFIKMSLALFFKIKTIKRLKKLLSNLDSYSAFSKVTEACSPLIKGFDKEIYQPFFDKMATECGDDKHFNFFEHSYYNNLGLPFEIETKDRYIYSPHAYDVFIDSPLYNSYSSNERIKVILDGIKQNQERMNIPVVMGEWGGGANNGNNWLEHIDYIYSVIEENKWSSLYWGFRFKNNEFVNVMNRPYPVAVCGEIIRYKTNSKSRIFDLEYNCKENKAKTIVYVPNKGMVEFDNEIGINRIALEY